MKPSRLTILKFLAAGGMAIVVASAGLILALLPAGAEEAAVAASAVDPGVLQWAFISAAVAAGLGTLAAGYAVAVVGSAAVGALTEKPELLGRVLILVGLAEGIAIYGLIVAILILNRAG
ncbi:MAG: H+transporting two-sector ATPase C subunit [Hyphomicrobiales bacterium]|nr:MAG: H+transporting two-sector ATPase C subunit [Hyphomicrobiales bacterium]